MARKLLYGVMWQEHMDPLAIEMEMCRRGGNIKRADGSITGNGMFWHWKRAQQLLWPDIPECFARKKWHRWNELQAECYVKYRTMAVLGPASSGKTNSAATDALFDYYLWPTCTTIIICSTTRERLEDRVWGEIKKYHKQAKERYGWLPGNLIEGRLRLVTDSRTMAEEGRDFRNGVIGVSCKRGDNYVGMGEFAGIKNKRVRLIGDELSLLPRAFVDAISNLDKNPDFKAVGLGNPKETTDALGVLAEPSAEVGGWESGIDQTPVTKTWPTRRPDGVCLQLVGSDSPNLDGALGIPLITQEQIDRDIAFYGKDSLQFTMMNQGMMPRGQGSHRVLTRQMCQKFRAFDAPVWRDSNIKKIAFLDAGYGGDRCVFGELNFGRPAEIDMTEVATMGALAQQESPVPLNRQVLAIVDTMIVPVSVEKTADLPEDQIVAFVVEQCQKRGISLDDFFYDPGLRTKLTVAFSRITGRIGNPIDCGGKPSERPVANGIDMRCVDYYSKFVTELWWSVRLTVESGQFRGLTQEAMWEFCAREWRNVSGNRIEVESKDDMKKKTGRSPDCFVAGTMVELVDGPCPIELVRDGDMVVTPFGPSPVIKVHQQDVESVEEVCFSDGTTLRGKPGHKVFTWDDGWVRLDALSIANEIETIYNLSQWHSVTSWFTREGSTSFKHQVDTIKTKTGTVSLSDFYTELSGKSIMGRFLTGLLSITKTAIGATMNSAISNLKGLASTCGTIAWNGSLTVQSSKRDGWKRDGKQPRNGMDHQKGERGTLNTARNHGSDASLSLCHAASVESFSSRSGTMQSTARTVAQIKLRERITGILESVRSAVRALMCSVLKPRNTVHVAARRTLPPARRRVFNLTLSEHNAYYANGILVENCADAITIGVEGARQRGFTIVKTLARPPGQTRSASERWKTQAHLNARKLWKAGDLDYAA